MHLEYVIISRVQLYVPLNWLVNGVVQLLTITPLMLRFFSNVHSLKLLRAFIRNFIEASHTPNYSIYACVLYASVYICLVCWFICCLFSPSAHFQCSDCSEMKHSLHTWQLFSRSWHGTNIDTAVKYSSHC